MKTVLRLASSTAVLLSCASVLAADTAVTTQLAQACQFTTPSFVANIPPVLGVTNVGSMGFSCNFVGQTNVTLTVANGTFLINGPHKVRYEIKWDAEASPGPNFQYSPNPVSSFSVTFPANTHLTPNTSRLEPVWVQLDQVPTVAGTYSSVAVYTLSP